MRLHAKKRVEAVVERAILDRLLKLLDELSVTGYTVVPAIAGRGHAGAWREDKSAQAAPIVVVTCLVDPRDLPDLLAPLYHLIETKVGIVSVSDVEVIRDAHF